MDNQHEIKSTIYAIGDIHGHPQILEKLLKFIRTDAANRELPPVLYFIGDLVDRGPDSKGAISAVVEAMAEFEGSKLHLGNHDEWLLATLEGKITNQNLMVWLSGQNGGQDTLTSYCTGGVGEFVDFVRTKHPDHIRLLQNASLYTQHGGIVFAHAGIKRGVPMKLQDQETLIWIREGFLDSPENDGRLVIHGHTPVRSGKPEVSENRVDIDTGIFFTGKLTCAVLDPHKKTMEFFQVNRDETEAYPVQPEPFGDAKLIRKVLENPFSFEPTPEIDLAD